MISVSASLTRYDGLSGRAPFRGTVAFAPGAATNRAEYAEADAARVRSADGRRARLRAIERGVCAGSVAFNVFQAVAR